MVTAQEEEAFRRGTIQGQALSPRQREQMLEKYLPKEPINQLKSTPRNNGPRFHHRQRVRPAMRHILHALVFNLIHIFFSNYVRTRQIYHALVDRALAVLYYHHRTPELIKRDVKGLSKVPQHLSVILELQPTGGKKDGLETLLNDACELAAWSASAGVPMLSIYERTGEDNHVLGHLSMAQLTDLQKAFLNPPSLISIAA
jgi:dehydrodolichyl diphosphate syntase complex subunit NUS1